MGDVIGWVVAILGLVLSAAGVWLTVLYGEHCTALLRNLQRSDARRSWQ
jgi:hypothetical protein